MILFWYAVSELLFPLGLGAGVLSAIMMMDQIYKFVPFLRATGLELAPLGWMMIYSLPTILMLTTPISLMVGTYAGLNRLSQDYEIISMRAAGVTLRFLFKPVLFVALMAALVVTWLAFYASPWGVRGLEQLKYEILKKQTRISLTEGKINNFFGQKSIYLSQKTDEKLTGIFIADWKDPEGASLIEAKEGKILFDEKHRRIFLVLYQGRIHQLGENQSHRIIDFTQLDYHLNSPDPDRSNLPSRYQNPNKAVQLNDMQMSIERLWEEVGKAEPQSQPYREYLDEFHGRITTILSCFAFAIFSLPMGIFDPRNPKTMRFVYMIVMMVLYYSLYSQARGMMVQGKASAALMYLPLVLGVALGLFNYFKINYDLTSIPGWLAQKIRGTRKNKPKLP